MICFLFLFLVFFLCVCVFFFCLFFVLFVCFLFCFLFLQRNESQRTDKIFIEHLKISMKRTLLGDGINCKYSNIFIY